VFGLKKPSTPPSEVNMIGNPSLAARTAIKSLKLAHPKDFFDLQITPEFIESIVKGTNLRAAVEGARGDRNKNYGDFVPFDSVVTISYQLRS
jgi:hypothetical protein